MKIRDRVSIEGKLKEIISQRLEISPDKITPASKLRDDLGIDSFGAVEIVFEVKDKFAVTISEEDLKSIVTVADIASVIMKKF